MIAKRIARVLFLVLVLSLVLCTGLAFATPGVYIDSTGLYSGKCTTRLANLDKTTGGIYRWLSISIDTQVDNVISSSELCLYLDQYDVTPLVIPCTGYIGDNTKPYFVLQGTNGDGIVVELRGLAHTSGSIVKYISGTIIGYMPAHDSILKDCQFTSAFSLRWYSLP